MTTLMEHPMRRRRHRKSKEGCTNCKRRRVKCDEQVPCENCVRRNEDCDIRISKSMRPRLNCSACLSRENSLEWSREMFLIHHYGQYTSLTLMQKVDVQNVFQKRIPEEAMKYPSLMQGLLTLSALHLAYLRPLEKETWVPVALKYQDKALASLRLGLTDIREDNCNGMFALSTIVFITSILQSTLIPRKPLQVSDLIQPALLVRGTRKIMDIGLKWIQKGIMAPALECHTILNYCQVSMPGSIQNQLEFLRKLFRERVSAQVILKDLLEALHCLELIYKEIVFTRGTANKAPGVVWKWPNLVSHGYITLLQESHPGALVLYCHFSIMIEVFKDEWYLQNWAERVVNGICSTIEPDWTDAIDWPMMQIREGLADFAGEVEK